MNLTDRPIYQKTPKQPTLRKQMRQRSRKKAAHMASEAGKADLDHMGKVKACPCAACGRVDRPRDAHHCRDMPPAHLRHVYSRIPGGGMKSGSPDTISLCGGEGNCHWQFHNRRSEFHGLYGPDYLYILPTRAQVAAMDGEIDF